MRSKGPWSEGEVAAFLAEVRTPIRIACNGASGHPVLASLWFAPMEGRLWCATQRSGRVARLLARDPRCAFEISVEAPPYRGVRGQGVVELHEGRGEEVLRRLIDRYLGASSPELAARLLSRSSREIALALEPRTLVSWDFSERMRESAPGGTATVPGTRP